MGAQARRMARRGQLPSSATYVLTAEMRQRLAVTTSGESRRLTALLLVWMLHLQARWPDLPDDRCTVLLMAALYRESGATEARFTEQEAPIAAVLSECGHLDARGFPTFDLAPSVRAQIEHSEQSLLRPRRTR